MLAGKVPACKWVKAACRRHLEDLKRSKTRDFVYRYEPEFAARACRFIEGLPHVKGRWAKRGERLLLQPFQIFKTCSIFGWVDKRTGRRRFRRAYICEPRKNGKSPWAAAVGLYMFCADGEHGAEVYSGATSEKQAWEVFRPAREMVLHTPELIKAFGIEVNAKTLVILKNGSRFEPVIGKPGDGASPSCAIVDEFHEHASDELHDTMSTGMVGRENPIELVITTAGSDRSGPCYAMQKDVEKILDGIVEDESTFGIIFTIDEGDDWKSVAALIKANPNYGVSVDAEILQAEQRAAIQSARAQNTFKTKHLNLWVNADIAWMNMAAWDACRDASLRIEDFAKQPCVIALDLASRVDVASKLRMFWKDIPVAAEQFIGLAKPGRCSRPDCANGREEMTESEFVPLFARGGREYCAECRDKVITRGERHFHIFAQHYLNDKQVHDAPGNYYAGWANDNRLVVTPGNVTDYGWIADDLVRDASQFTVLEVPHDPYHAAALVQFIQQRDDWNKNVTFVEVQQNVRNMSPAMKEAEAVVLDGRLHHDGDPVLGWMMANVVCHRDRKGNIFPSKEREENKIDGAVCLFMALMRAQVQAGMPTGFRPSIFDKGNFWSN